MEMLLRRSLFVNVSCHRRWHKLILKRKVIAYLRFSAGINCNKRAVVIFKIDSSKEIRVERNLPTVDKNTVIKYVYDSLCAQPLVCDAV